MKNPAAPKNPLRLESAGGDLLLFIKVVPGASRSTIAGVVGDRLKVRVSAPPEGGKANKAVCRIIATALHLRPNKVSLERGLTHPEKVVRISDMSEPDARRLLLAKGKRA